MGSHVWRIRVRDLISFWLPSTEELLNAAMSMDTDMELTARKYLYPRYKNVLRSMDIDIALRRGTAAGKRFGVAKVRR